MIFIWKKLRPDNMLHLYFKMLKGSVEYKEIKKLRVSALSNKSCTLSTTVNAEALQFIDKIQKTSSKYLANCISVDENKSG